MTRFAGALLLILALAAAACGGGKPEVAESGKKQPSSEPPHAAAEGVLCKEHGVLEAVCTKCNPALIPVFKAKGDWCEEHGFPESFCPICHPDRGGRPAASVSGDDAPADGTKVRFKSKETARLAGIEVEKAQEPKGASHVVVTARILYDATKVAEVNARSAGVVLAVRADIGTKVRRGSALASIQSAAVGADQSRLLSTRSRVQVAEANYARLKQLYEEGIVPEKDALDARQELDAARAELSSAESALDMVGSVAEGASRYTLTSPIAGVVTRRDATIGHLVDTEAVLFEIVDTSTMWAELDIPETAVTRIAVGRPVILTVDGLGDREFTGTLSYISPLIDPHTRTATGRVALANPEGLLRANMFARARIAVTGSGASVVVPREAVQRAKSVHLVFVRTAVDTFEARRVQVGPGDGDFLEVRGRLKPGEEVATAGSFLLKTETLKGSIGTGCCDVEEKK